MKIYYGLTEKEIKKKFLIYKGNGKYLYKGINTTLKGLRDFIIDNELQNVVKYYTVIDSSNFQILDDIIKDEKYNMITVMIPFTFEIEKIKCLF